MKRKTAFGVAASLCLSLILVAVPLASGQSGGGTTAPDRRAAALTTDIQLLAINDFHGTLEPPAGLFAGVPTGGVEFLATHLRRLEATNPNTLVVSAGDLIGASPLISALFHDEPTIEAANLFGLDFNAVGNHEFDEGEDELLRMQFGGCHPIDGCQDGDPFGGAAFEFLAANVVRKASGDTIFPPYRILPFRGSRLAIIGMTLEGTPSIVSPGGIARLDFKDEADTVNALVPTLKRQGAEAIVVLVHEGGVPTGSFNACPGISGPIVDIVNRTDDEVDLFITGHTHQAYNCVIDGRPVTSASSFGRVLTKIDLQLSRITNDVSSIRVDNRLVTRDVARDPAQTQLVAKYSRLSAPLANRVIGRISGDLTRTENPAGESTLGDVIADAQLDSTSAPDRGGAQIAFMNPGGIRADFLLGAIAGGEAAGEITYGEAFTVQPFGNTLTTLTLTGAQIERLLERQWEAPQPFPRILKTSRGFTYTWDAARAPGDRVDPASIRLNGQVLSPTGLYRVTVNNFLAEGGDNFTVLAEGTNRVGGELDLDALVRYFAANSPVAPGPLNRIQRLN